MKDVRATSFPTFTPCSKQGDEGDWSRETCLCGQNENTLLMIISCSGADLGAEDCSWPQEAPGQPLPT